MDIRYSANPNDVKRYTTDELRKEFLIENLYQPDTVVAVYSHVDRMVTLGCMPVHETVPIDKGIDIWANFGTQYFLQRREILLRQRLPGIEALLGDDPGGHPHLRAVVEPQHHPASVSAHRCELLQDHTRSSSSKSSAEMFTAPPATVAGPGAGAPRRLAIFSSCCRATSARMAASSASACSGLSRR